MKKKKYLFCSLVFLAGCILLSYPAYSYSQSSWARAYGGPNYDNGGFIQQTIDGGYIIAGNTESFGTGANDFWILKLDHYGNITWQKTYGGPYNDNAGSIQQTSDGGYIVVGITNPFVAGWFYDIWILKLDSSGDVTWQKTYGGSNDDNAGSIQPTSDGGYIVAGSSDSFGSGLYDYDFWVLKLDSSGNVVWQKTYGGAAEDRAGSIRQTSEGGYIVAGTTASFGAGGWDFWVLKLDSLGDVTWQKKYGSPVADLFESIQPTSDGGYIVAGFSDILLVGFWDVLLLKLDASGNVVWQKAYGDYGDDFALSIQPTSDGGYITAGYTPSYGFGDELWLIKLDSSGDIVWQKTYGGSQSDYGGSIQQTIDGGYIVAGVTRSFGAGASDLWVLKLFSDGTMEPSCTFVHTIAIGPIISSVSSSDTSAIISSPTFITTDTLIAPVNSTASQSILCSSSFIALQPWGGLKPQVDDTGSSTPNGVIEPDEPVTLPGHLQNIGDLNAVNTSGILTSNDPILITQPNAGYGTIPAGADVVGTPSYALTAPLANRSQTHWDFNVTENVTADACGPFYFDYQYHVGNSFSDVLVSNLFYKYIETLLHYRLSVGCTLSTYCPNNYVTRDQMAKFICSSMETSAPGSCVIAACTGIFGDVPATNAFCGYIERLSSLGIVYGCQASPRMYCPSLSTQRQAMAKFVCKGMEASQPGSCITSSCTGVFTDVPSGNIFCPFIEALYNAGIISGCGSGMYCPSGNVTRAQMAKFIVGGWNFEL